MSKKTKSTPYTTHLKLFKKVSNDLTGVDQATFQHWIDPKRVKSAIEYLRTIEFVPTIFRKEEPDKVSSFYHETKVKKKREKSHSLLVNSYDDFKSHQAIVVEGIVGQGKSILLRYLHNKELNKGFTLPIFIELKEADSDIPIKELIIDFIHEKLGLRCNEALFDTLLELGLFSFFFDGFDEVAYKERAKLVQFIGWINTRCSHSRIIVTTRPGNEVQQAQGFEVFYICPLSEEEQIDFVKKLNDNYPEVFQQDFLIKNISSLSPKLRKILGTPLILSLFAMVYRNQVKIPESHSEFYQKLFDTLVSEHDGLKVGFTRPTKSKVRAEELKLIIENIAYSLMLEKKSSKEDFIIFIKQALSDLNIRADSEKVLWDIIKNTCLVQVDNHKYRFIHETIEFYFAASYLKNNADDEDASHFYSSCKENWSHWFDVLLFLEDIDKIRYSKHFYKKEIESLFEKSKLPDTLTFTLDSAKNFAKNIFCGEIELHDIDDQTVSNKSGFVGFSPTSSFVFKKNFIWASDSKHSTSAVNVTKLIDNVDLKVKHLRKANKKQFESLIARNCKESREDTFILRITDLNCLLDEFSLHNWFLTELNRIPLDNLRRCYSSTLEVIKKKTLTKSKGRFIVS